MVSKRIYVLLVAMSITLFALSACAKATPTEDPSLKITQVAATVQAELTQIFLLTPSSTPTQPATVTPTITVTPTLSTPMGSATPTKALGTSTTGDNAKFGSDVTIPDGTLIKPGATFEKTWAVVNTGTTTWTTDYQLMYLQGPQATTLFVKLAKSVAPGETAQITVKFVAPTALGSYTGWWTLYNASGYPFGEQLSVVFTVGNETATPTSSTPSVTETVTPTVSTTS